MAAIYVLSMVLLSAIRSSSAAYKVEMFNETIVNPDFPTHDIPVYVYYPVTSNKSMTFPTIVFAHGFECEASYYGWIHQDIAPLGFIVAYINSYPSGALNQTQFAIDQRYTLQWLNTVETPTAPRQSTIKWTPPNHTDSSSPIYHQVDTTKSMASGHSEGGGASFMAMGDAYINQLFAGKYTFNSIFTMAPCGQLNTAQNAQNIPHSIPIFVFTGTMDCICPSPEPRRLYDNVPKENCKYYADVTNATHCHWMNAPMVKEEACTAAETDICAFMYPNRNMTIPLQEQLNIASEYMQLFLTATITDNGQNSNAFKQILTDLEKDKQSGEINIVLSTNAC
eukprot:CAMPEP_0197077666 /NCGR_PEP_ID=MMETSP1384-20130603/212736_1 /TAXON_ID=29189 /ORGANISM="Ammonia sp." /LENGTH=337 /DNA_ID=CAMNT_0042516531 /DNA_START=18 /DNA_END=1032 /DNA_ORIENTATION=-